MQSCVPHFVDCLRNIKATTCNSPWSSNDFSPLMSNIRQKVHNGSLLLKSVLRKILEKYVEGNIIGEPIDDAYTRKVMAKVSNIQNDGKIKCATCCLEKVSYFQSLRTRLDLSRKKHVWLGKLKVVVQIM